VKGGREDGGGAAWEKRPYLFFSIFNYIFVRRAIGWAPSWRVLRARVWRVWSAAVVCAGVGAGGGVAPRRLPSARAIDVRRGSG